MAKNLDFKPTARPHPVQISVQVKLQQIGRIITGTTRSFRLDADKSRRLQIQPIDEGLDEPDRIVGPDIVVHHFRQKQHL